MWGYRFCRVQRKRLKRKYRYIQRGGSWSHNGHKRHRQIQRNKAAGKDQSGTEVLERPKDPATKVRVDAYVASRPGLREKLDAYKKAELERAPHVWVFEDGQCVQGDPLQAETFL